MGYTPKEADLLRRLLVEEMKGEYAIMSRIVDAVPTDKLHWQPTQEKSKPFSELAGHAAGAGRFFLTLLDGQAPTEPNYKFKSKKALAKAIKDYETEFLAGLAKYTPQQLAKEYDFFGSKHPGITLLRWHHLHLIHHRGQCSTYLRIMGAKVPSVYGGSADEPMGG